MQLDLSGLDDIKIEGTQDGMATSRNKVDIVFLIDDSASMEPLINGVQKNINSFISSLQNSGNRVDFRIGFELYGNLLFTSCNLTEDVEYFKQKLAEKRKLETGGGESTLIALDMAADQNWREQCHKYIIMFTDEPLSSNNEYEKQLTKYDELIQKLKDLQIKVYFLGKDCPDYRRLKEIKHCYYEPVDNYANVNYAKLLDTIGKSVSQQSGSELQQSLPVKRNIYVELFEIETAEKVEEKTGEKRYDLI